MNAQERELIAAARTGDFPRLETLVAAGIDSHIRDDVGNTLVMLILRRPADMTLPAPPMIEDQGDTFSVTFTMLFPPITPLSLKAKEVIADLLQRGVPINARNNAGQSALMIAVSERDLDTVELLLAHGADVNLKDQSGHSALLWAAGGNKFAVIKLLLEHGADPNTARTIDGITTLMLEASFGDVRIVELLVKHGADVRLKNRDSETALDLAQASQNTQAIAYLMRI